MAKLSKEDIQRLNKQINDGTILCTVHNTSYHLIVKVNTECIVLQSMEAEDKDKGLVINLRDFRESLNSSRGDQTEDPQPDYTQSSTEESL